uniref:PCI domain-containing protein n=2 Tax=Schistocephalus solidus TaxID=70667 RepID=A0A0X3PWJ8_SCHSO
MMGEIAVNTGPFVSEYQRSNQIMQNPVAIDLSAYAANYSGYIKYQRLFFIAENCPALKYEALKLAHDYIKKFTLDTEAYNRIFETLASQNITDDTTETNGSSNDVPANPTGAVQSVSKGSLNGAGFVYDPAWIQKTCSDATHQRELLETELKNAKANFIKEYIRKGSVKLGHLYLNMGQLDNAMKYYMCSKDYCTARKQDINMCLNVIKIAVYRGMWSHVSAFVTRAENLSDEPDPSARKSSTSEAEIRTSNQGSITTGSPSSAGALNAPATASAKSQLAIAAGLVKLASSNYRDAALCFLQAHYDENALENDFITPSDLAFYVTLCSLATFDRAELKSQVLSSPSFRLILESEVQCCEILNAFHQANYAACLGALAKVQDLFRLDIFLSGHVSHLCHAIRLKAMCQYFTPYLTADLNMMARAFATTVAELENELAKLIQDGSIKARIDSHRQLLCALNVDQRCSTFANAIRIADECHLRCQAAILRSNLIRHGLAAKQPIPYEMRAMIQPPARWRGGLSRAEQSETV